MTDSAISGPIPSPGKRVARIRVESDEKTLAACDDGDEEDSRLGLGFAAPERNWVERLPRARLNRWEAIIAACVIWRSKRITLKPFSGL